MVPLTYDDWRHIPEPQKELIWESVKQKYILDEELGKNYTLQLIGKLWRAHKSRLRKKIRDCENKEDIKVFKPGGVQEKEWETFVRKMSNKEFKKKSKKFKEMRAQQDLPHTCSRQGYARLEEQMKKESPDPSLIDRTRVWLRGHTKKNGEPANANVAEKIKKIRDFEDSTPNSSRRSIKNDALSQVIGPDRNGRLRGVGHGVTTSKLGASSRNSALVTQFHEEMAEMKGQVAQLTDLVTSQKKFIDTLVAKLQSHCEGNVELQQLDRPNTSSSSPNISHTQPLEHDGNVLTNSTIENSSTHILKGARHKDLETSLATTSDLKRHGDIFKGQKCKLIDLLISDEVVAYGRWETDDPNTKVHFVPLGKNASRVWVERVIKPNAPLWRKDENLDLDTIGSAEGCSIAWPTSHIIFADDN